MMEKLEHAELQSITLHNSAVNWYKKGKEIIVNSALFDVHHYLVKKDSTVFTGLLDAEETELKKRVKKLMEKKDQENSEQDLIIAKLMMQLWMNDDKKDYEFLQLDSINTNNFIVAYNLLSADISIPFPPPKA